MPAHNHRPRLSSILSAMIMAAACIPATLSAQNAPAATGEPVFQTGAYYAGPRIWIGNLNGAMAIGGQIERGFTQPGQYGPGIIAAGVGVDYYSWDQDFGVGHYDYSVIPIQLFGNYHFPIASMPKLDPYVGIALVYQRVSASWTGAGAASSAAGSGTDFAGQLGARYFLTEKMAIQAQVGFGYGTLGLGATWRF